MTTVHLSREHGRTLQAIFHHPLAHNLEWQKTRALLEAIGTVTEEHNGRYRVTVNGQTHVMHRPQHKDFAASEALVALRHFLEQAGAAPTGPHQQGDPGDDTSTHAGGN